MGGSGQCCLAVLGGRAETDTTSASVGLSYRFSESTQIFASMPYVIQRNTVEDLASGEIARSTSQGFQTLGLGVRRILLSEGVGVPQITGTIDAAVPMQSGLQRRLGVELSVMKSLDPVTVFATARAERAFGDGNNDSGNRMIASFGYVFALNDTLAVSTALNARVEDAMDTTGLGWRRAKRFELKLGMPTSFGKSGFFLEPHVSFGLNQSNSATTVGVSLVKTFAP